MRRMFSSDFLDNDKFLELPISAKLLYIYLNMYADSEGFVASTRKAIMSSGATTDDMRVLLAKNFIKELNEDEFTKVYLVTDFWQNNSSNLLYSPSFKETDFQVAKGQVVLVNKVYMNIEDYNERLLLGENIQATEISKGHSKTSRKKFEKPTLEEVQEYCKLRNNNVNPKDFYDYYENCEWTVKDRKTSKRKPMDNWKNTVITWEKNDKQYNKQETQQIDYMKF